MRAITIGSVAPTTSSVLTSLPLFEGVPAASLRRLAAAATITTLPAGELLFAEDDAGDDLFAVVQGRLEVLGPGGSDRLAWIGPKGIVGERAMLDGGQRCATVRATRDCVLMRIPGAVMEQMFTRHPAVLRRLTSTVADRVRVRTAAPTPGATTVAVVAIGGTERWRLAQLCAQLADVLNDVGPATVIDRQADFARPTAADSDAGFVIYEAGAIRSEWTRRCLRQADRVVLVADADADPTPRGDETLVLASAVRPGVRRDLVLLHAGDAPIAGTARWLEGRSVDGWHHVTSDPESLARLGRHLRGDAVTLVLGGGGARGLAHLGIVRALEHSEVPVDAVGGTSIGAIMGAFVALNWSDERRMATAKTGFVDTRRLVGYTLPLLSLSSSKKLTRLLRHHLGDTRIEDLPVPFFCVSANYSTGDAVIHDRGPLWWALRASISLPGVLPPVYADGDLLVDGGVVNNLPVDLMQARHPGSVIAVDLRSRPGDRTIPAFEPTISGWQLLAHRLHPRRHALRLPGPAATMLRAKELSAKDAHRRRRAAADMLLEPPVGSVDSMDFRAALPLAESAYNYTLEMLKAARPSLQASVEPPIPFGVVDPHI